MVLLPQLPRERRVIVDDDECLAAHVTNPVIGIHGLMGVGKTALAMAIREGMQAEGYKGDIWPFAGPVKEIARLMGWNGHKDEKGRLLLQLLGTQCGRQCIDPDVWVKKWWNECARSALARGEFAIADDLRFPNEWQQCCDAGGLLIKVVRPGLDCGTRRRWWQFWRPKPHASEIEMPDDNFHMIFHNDGTLDDVKLFGKRVATLLAHYFPQDG